MRKRQKANQTSWLVNANLVLYYLKDLEQGDWMADSKLPGVFRWGYNLYTNTPNEESLKV